MRCIINGFEPLSHLLGIPSELLANKRLTGIITRTHNIQSRVSSKPEVMLSRSDFGAIRFARNSIVQISITFRFKSTKASFFPFSNFIEVEKKANRLLPSSVRVCRNKRRELKHFNHLFIKETLFLKFTA